nr:unnamed protein product [Digitaria exilis]
MSAALTRLRAAVGRVGPPGARVFSVAAAEAEAAAPRRESRAFAAAAVAAGSGLGIWLLPSNPQPLADSGLADAATEAGGDKGGFSAFFGGVGAAGEREEERNFLFGDSYRRRVFFNYEKRIRTRSPPEKIFEYFASVHGAEGEMDDMSRHLAKYLSLWYIFFVTLLSIPESSFNVAFKMFDLDHNGEIEKDEFKKVMTLMRSYHRQGAAHRDGLRFGRKVGQPVENGGLVEYFFGKDGNKHLHYDKFSSFLKQLHDEIVRLKFSHYDVKSSKTIPVKDFALSMVASADMNHINKLLDRVDDLDVNPGLKDQRVTFEEFKAFADLRRRLEPFAMAIFSYGKVCGVDLTDKVVDIIFHVFDSDRDGNLSSEEFLRSDNLIDNM